MKAKRARKLLKQIEQEELVQLKPILYREDEFMCIMEATDNRDGELE